MVVREGLAVAAIPLRMVGEEGFRVLGRADGMPPLGSFDIGLMKGAEGNPIVDAFYDHVLECFGRMETMAAA